MAKRSHGTGTVTAYKDGHQLKWSTPEGGRGSKVFGPSTRPQAERELRRILTEVEKGEHQDDRRGSVTFDAFFSDWGRRCPPCTHPRLRRHPVFLGERAARMPSRSLQDAWNDAVAAAGLENFHVHDVRHVGLSLVAEAGASERVVQERAGHASATITRRYLHSNERMHADAVEKVDALVSKLQQENKRRKA